MNIVAFAASTSTKSINKKLVTYATSLLENVSVEILDLNDYEIPLFSQDKEEELGQPQAAIDFLAKLNEAEALVISFAEHNGSYSAAYKNLFDWCSRIQQKVYQDKSVILLSASPGKGGASSVLAQATNSMPFFGAEVKATFSLPSFYNNFDVENNKLIDSEMDKNLLETMTKLIG